jgi:hypothetical protein
MGLVQETGQLLSRLLTHRSVCQRDAGETVGPKKAACRDGPILLKNSKMELKQATGQTHRRCRNGSYGRRWHPLSYSRSDR